MAGRPSQYSATRFEQLLGVVEAGSLRDYNKLMQEWPTDITLAHRIQALTVALAQLELQPATIPDDTPTPNTEPREDPHRPKIQAIHILSMACNGTEHLTDEGKAQVYSILRQNLDGLISWLTFLAEAPYAQLPTNERVEMVYLAVSRLAMVFAQLLVLGLKNEPETLLAERVVHSALDLWMTDPFEAEWLEAETPLLTRAGYEESIHPVLHLFWFCTDEESLREILLEKINGSWKKSWQKRFAKSFAFRCRQWEMVFKQGGQERTSSSTGQGAWGLFIIYRMAELLRGAHVLQRRLIQDQFSATVLKLALDFSDRLSQPGEVSLAVTVASEIFPLVNPTAQEVLKVVPELIKAGLLNIIIHELLSPLRVGLQPFNKWRNNPLKVLNTMAYHPQIYFAIEEVAARIPSQTMASLEEIPVWREFISSGIVYKTAYAEMAHLEDVPLCDNFQHYNTSGTTTNSYRYNLRGAECSWCRTRVYCSIECQTVDWDALHKKECIASRVSRIELELNSAWISHRTRMRFYTLLAKFTLTRYPDDPNESLFVDTRISPPSYRLYPAPVFRDMKYDGRRLFDEERSKAFLEDSLAKKDEVRVVGFLATLGQYLVVGLGRVRPVDMASNPRFIGQQLAPGNRYFMVSPLTLYVKVI